MKKSFSNDEMLGVQNAVGDESKAKKQINGRKAGSNMAKPVRAMPGGLSSQINVNYPKNSPLSAVKLLMGENTLRTVVMCPRSSL